MMNETPSFSCPAPVAHLYYIFYEILLDRRRGAGRGESEAGRPSPSSPDHVNHREMDALSLHRNEFHGGWNYELHPR